MFLRQIISSLITSSFQNCFEHTDTMKYSTTSCIEIDFEHAKPQRNADIAKSVEDVQEMIDTV